MKNQNDCRCPKHMIDNGFHADGCPVGLAPTKSKTVFHKEFCRKGSTQRIINVERSGRPFGQVWTFKNTRITKNPWHAKPLKGEHRTFDKLADAKAYMKRS